MAIDMFEAYFGFSPLGTTCACCGLDYSIYDEETDVEPARCAGVLVVSLADVLNAQGVKVFGPSSLAPPSSPPLRSARQKVR